MGFASSRETRDTLAGYGIRVGGYRWRWALGLKGGTYPPHYHQNNEFASDAGEFPALPGDDVNGDSCACNLVPVYRSPDGRFAKPGLTPIFQPAPVTAAVERYVPQELDLTPLYDLLAQERQMNVSIPDGAIVVNIPPQRDPVANVYVPEFPNPDFASMPAPVVNVAAPNVAVSPAEVTVNLPPSAAPHTLQSTYFAGISGTVKIPKGHKVASWSAVTDAKAGTVKIGAATITIPPTTGDSDELDDAPLDVRSMVFRNTVAYQVRTVH